MQREGKRVRLFTRNGHDWSRRFLLITEAALRISFVPEPLLLVIDGRSDFNRFYAFDVLMSKGEGSMHI